ncbi:MAG: DUF7557 family protein [Candidatus Heimdallarchaeaceae archaeon]
MKSMVIKDETHKKLMKLGNKGETFDEIINRLIETYLKVKK